MGTLILITKWVIAANLLFMILNIIIFRITRKKKFGTQLKEITDAIALTADSCGYTIALLAIFILLTFFYVIQAIGIIIAFVFGHQITISK